MGVATMAQPLTHRHCNRPADLHCTRAQRRRLREWAKLLLCLAMNLRTILFGKPLRSDAEPEEQIGALQAFPVLGLDGLASASYGPEAALTILLVIGATASQQIVPVSAAIIGLLLIVYLSYRQTLAAYPHG